MEQRNRVFERRQQSRPRLHEAIGGDGNVTTYAYSRSSQIRGRDDIGKQDMTEVGTTGKAEIEGNRGIRTWKVDGHLATTSSAGDDHLARRANKWDCPTQSITIRQSQQGGPH